MSSLALPALKALSVEEQADLSDMLCRIYQHCIAHPHAPFGRPYMSWKLDLRRHDFRVRRSPEAPFEKLERWAFTPHMNERGDPVAAELAFHFAGRVEGYFLGEWLSFTPPQAYLTGNEFERTFPATLSAPVPPDEWDLWGRGVTAQVSRHYEEIIHPKVVETIGAIARRQPGRSLFVCDGVAQVRPMLVADRSPALVAQAQRRASMHPGRMLARRADILAGDFFEGLDTPDVVVLCGVVAQQVMEQGEGRRLVQRCRDELRPGGFALVPSYSPALLTADDYGAMGFEVHNRTLNLWEEGPDGRTLKTNDFYVLEKK
jgi:hypothetical protein